jgi:hypothetical protein
MAILLAGQCVHAEAPDHRAARLSYHIKAAGNAGHGPLPGQINSNQRVNGKGRDEPG